MKKEILSVVITDTHIKPTNIKLVEDIFSQLISWCKKNKVKRIIHAGDWFYSRTSQPLDVLKSTTNIIKNIIDAGLEVDIVPGNHDKTDLSDSFSYLSIFSSDEFRVHSNPVKISIGGVDFTLIPYYPEQGNLPDLIKECTSNLNSSQKNVCVSHCGINGGLANDNATTSKEVSPKLFKFFDYTYVGHYHNQNQINGHNIFYVGSSHASNYGEDNNKGVTAIMSDGSHEFFKLDFPEFETLRLNVDQIDDEKIKEIEIKVRSEKKNVRVIVEGDESKLKTLKRGTLDKAGVKKIQLKDVSMKLTKEEISSTFVNLDKKEILVQYGKFLKELEMEDNVTGIEYLKKSIK